MIEGSEKKIDWRTNIIGSNVLGSKKTLNVSI